MPHTQTEIQHQCGTCRFPVREYPSGWQHVYRTVESQHDVPFIVCYPITETYV